MAHLLILFCGVFAAMAAAAGVGAVVFGERAFQTRIDARLRPVSAGPSRTDAIVAGLSPKLLQILTQWGRTAGRGAIEHDKRAELRLRLVQAGFYDDRAVEVFFGIRAIAAVALAGLGLLLVLIAKVDGLLMPMMALMVGANLGLFGPNLLLKRRIAQRGHALHNALPDVIDLMVVSVEAGATLSAALQRVVAEFGEFHPIVSEQFGLMMMEMQAGASRAEALTRLAQRSPTDEVRSLTTMIIQSEAVGASLGDALRVFAEELRKTRYMEAERKANELPVKMAFPLVLFIFPCLVSTIFIPVLIRIMRTLLHG